ncbi:uncharacterized protein VTP21DRAFT_3232 [Calcarisporiella thermophila]|uniref:uncharacterized protein n=1 Tax=Calcarisporiella thermophila TaxID=911321 RepID=UPI0037429B5D
MAPLKVIGAGFGRTGTLSLMVALDQLGFGPCYHMFRLQKDHIQKFIDAADGKEVDWDEVFKDFNSCVDWPTTAFYRELLEKYPNAKIVLTIRDTPEEWYESARDTIFSPTFSEDWLRWLSLYFLYTNTLRQKMARKVIAIRTFHGGVRDKNWAIEVYNKRIQEVKHMVPPDRLLIFNASFNPWYEEIIA